jgi:hypothetical protein
MSKGSDGFTGGVLKGAPVSKVLPEPASARRVVETDEVVPQFNTMVLLEKIMPRATEQFMMDAVATAEGALVE